MSYMKRYKMLAIIEEYQQRALGPGEEVIRVQAAAFTNTGEAAGMLDASLDYLAATGWAALGTAAHAEMLARLQRAQTKLTAVNAAVLAAFTAGNGYEPDGHRSAKQWLIGKTGISQGAARRGAGRGGRPASAPAR